MSSWAIRLKKAYPKHKSEIKLRKKQSAKHTAHRERVREREYVCTAKIQLRNLFLNCMSYPRTLSNDLRQYQFSIYRIFWGGGVLLFITESDPLITSQYFWVATVIEKIAIEKTPG